jgi:protein-disulfide isomerase
MTVIVVMGTVGTTLGALAAWAGLWSPRANAARQAREDRNTRAREVHEALFGTPERRDDSGATIATARPGVLADMQSIKTKLDAPMLNGKGNDLIATVDRLDRRTAKIGRQLAAVERRIGAS